jgi:DNA replication protein DnaC
MTHGELSRFQLIIINEMGYLLLMILALIAFSSSSRGNTKKPRVYSPQISHVIAAAILDRILHHCNTGNIKGDSYRLKDRKRQGIIPQRFSRYGALRYGWQKP